MNREILAKPRRIVESALSLGHFVFLFSFSFFSHSRELQSTPGYLLVRKSSWSVMLLGAKVGVPRQRSARRKKNLGLQSEKERSPFVGAKPSTRRDTTERVSVTVSILETSRLSHRHSLNTLDEVTVTHLRNKQHQPTNQRPTPTPLFPSLGYATF